MAAFSSLHSITLLFVAIISQINPITSLPLGQGLNISLPLTNTNTALSTRTLVKRYDPVYITPLTTGYKSGRAPLRLELSVLAQDDLMRTLLVEGVNRMMARDDKDPKSWFAVGSIHGQRLEWNNVAEVDDGDDKKEAGYCTHGDDMFPIWHRPYIALMENILFEHIQEFAEECKDKGINDFETARKTWRFPYWDWSVDARMPPVMIDATINIFQINDEDKLQMTAVPNPLIGYRFKAGRFPGTDEAIEPFKGTDYTYRFAEQDTMTKAWRSDYASLNSVLAHKQLVWKINAFNIFLGLQGDKSWNMFSRLIENVHNDIHTQLGTPKNSLGMMGSMTDPVWSGYDPIFWFHHTQVDRLIAMYQAVYPDEYMDGKGPKTAGKKTMGTYALPKGLTIDTTTPMIPFEKSAGNYWTGADSKKPEAFGSSYADALGSKQDVIDRIMKTYAAPSTSMLRFFQKSKLPGDRIMISAWPTVLSFEPENDKSFEISKRDTGSLITPADFKPYVAALVDANGGYMEYTAEVSVKLDAVDDAFTVAFFLGEAPSSSSNPAAWALEPTFVGDFVSLTLAIYQRIVAKEDGLTNPTQEHITKYLKKNLKWMVSNVVQDQVVKNSKVDSLKVSIGETKMILATEGEVELPATGTTKIVTV